MTSLWLLNVGRKQSLSSQILCAICRKTVIRVFGQTCALNARERQVGLTIEETTKRKLLEREWPVKDSVREIPITSLKEEDDRDFFGIESDSGCIIVPEKNEKPSVEKIRQQLRKHERTSVGDERTIITTFGSVRFDSDNQQLGEDPKTKFSISEILDETDSLKKFYNLFYPNGQTREEFKPLSVNGKQKCEHLSSQIGNTCGDKVIEVLPNDTPIVGKEKSSEILQKEDTENYMDICYFGNELLNMTRTDSKMSKTEEFSVDNLSEELSETCNEDLGPSNFIDDFYFDNNFPSSSKGKDYSDTGMYVNMKEEELNYVDNVYFHDLYDSELHKDISNSKENKRCGNVTSGTKLNEPKISCNANKALGNWKQHLKECQVNLNNENVSGIQSNVKGNGIENNDITFCGSHRKDQMDLNGSSNAYDRQTVKSFEHVRCTENRELQELSQDENLTFNQLCSLDDQESGSVTDQYSSQISKFSDQRKPGSSRKVTLKDSIKAPKTSSSLESNYGNQNSAYNYILKLKNEPEAKTSITDEGINYKVSLTGEKLDSKGFRILKDQTVDLTQKTNLELLDMMKERILFSNDDIIIVDKPYGLVIHDSKTVKKPSLSPLLSEFARQLDKSSKDPQLYTVHRLDKETTGCFMLARNEKAAMYLKALFANHKLYKTYWIVTSNIPEHPEGIIDMPIAEGKIDHKNRMVIQPDLPSEIKYKSHVKNGKRAVTHYKVIATSGSAALVEVKPETGLKHQIRVHFGFGLGCPIIGDHKYSHLTKLAPQRLPSDILQKLHIRQSKVRYVPMHIHAKSIVIPDYFEKGRDLHITCPLPNHMSVNLRRLKFQKK